MLQRIHQKTPAPRASSLYCLWIRDSRRPGAPLVAVWIDSEMRGFERQCTQADEILQDAWDEPGGTHTLLLQ